MARILVVEDDDEIADSIEIVLTSEQHTVELCSQGDIAEQLLRQYIYDLIILDWNLPNQNGCEICTNYRANGGKTPVLFLTARKEIESKTKGLDAGADDYLVKPFHPLELRSRVKALLRRPVEYAGAKLACGELVMDLDKHRVTIGQTEVVLRPMEYSLLEFLLRHKNQLFTTAALLMNVWPPNTDASEETVRTHLKTLRKKLEIDGKAAPLANVHGVGYRLEEPNS